MGSNVKFVAILKQFLSYKSVKSIPMCTNHSSLFLAWYRAPQVVWPVGEVVSNVLQMSRSIGRCSVGSRGRLWSGHWGSASQGPTSALAVRTRLNCPSLPSLALPDVSLLILCLRSGANNDSKFRNTVSTLTIMEDSCYAFGRVRGKVGYPHFNFETEKKLHFKLEKMRFVEKNMPVKATWAWYRYIGNPSGK